MSAIEVGIGLGSNVGDKAATITSAVSILQDEAILSGVTVSALYRSEPWGHVTDQDWFVNACAVGVTTLAPADLLVRFKAIERRLGRTSTRRWGPRVIDIDLLFYGELALTSPGLIIPHKELMRRAFVLVPLAEIAPERKIGTTTVGEAAAAIDQTGIELYRPEG